jgi:hypothetical protein
VSEHFLREYDIMTQGQRNKHYVDVKHWRSSVHLVPLFGNMDISKITTGEIVEYRIHRHQQAIAKRGKPPANSTMHQDRYAAPDPENCATPRMARPASRFL